MERRAYILKNEPNSKEIAEIIACKDHAWVRNGLDFYPYSAFGRRQSWSPKGELGKKIVDRNLFVSLVKDENGEVVAHAALDKNKLGWELGRVFCRVNGHDYGLLAVENLRRHIESQGIDEIARGTSYNRTAVWKSYERSFGANEWKLAVLGILPDIYAEPKEKPIMHWGEIISRAVKGKDMILPYISDNTPAALKNFAQNIQKINDHCLKFGDKVTTIQKPSKFGESDTYVISWKDCPNQRKYLDLGYMPVGIIKIYDEWCFVVSKVSLPKRHERRGIDLQVGRSPVFYPKEAGGVEVHKVIDLVYNQ